MFRNPFENFWQTLRESGDNEFCVVILWNPLLLYAADDIDIGIRARRMVLLEIMIEMFQDLHQRLK